MVDLNMQRSLRENKSLFQRLCFFIDDLLKLKGADGRLDFSHATSEEPSSYLNTNYFNIDEQKWLLGFPTPNGGTVQAELQAFYQRHADSETKDHSEICSSHALAPLYQVWFGVTRGDLHGDAFRKEKKMFAKRGQKGKKLALIEIH